MANPNPSPSTRFGPGNRANPNGRPKGRSITDRLRAAIERQEHGGKALEGGRDVADLLVQVIIEGALGGDVRLIQLIVDRVDGKVPDTTSGGISDATQAIRDLLLGATEPPGDAG
jgi:hypothetical protein